MRSEIVVGTNETENVSKMYPVDASYALAYPTVSARMIAGSFFDENVMESDQQIEVRRTAVPELAGRRLDDTGLDGTDCVPVAVVRHGDVVTDFEGTTLSEDDDLVVADTDDEVEGSSPTWRHSYSCSSTHSATSPTSSGVVP